MCYATAVLCLASAKCVRTHLGGNKKSESGAKRTHIKQYKKTNKTKNKRQIKKKKKILYILIILNNVEKKPNSFIRNVMII